MKNIIIIQDWTGDVLFRGHYKDPEVDEVLDSNRCGCDGGCTVCDDTGYEGDITVCWASSSDKRNVYEFINY